jgi:hypothetical protein
MKRRTICDSDMGALVSGRPVVPEPQGMIARGNPRSPFRARFNATSCQSREAASPIHEVSSEIFRLFCAAYLKSCLAMADSPASLCPKPAPSWIPNEEIHHGSRFYHYHHSPCVSPLVLFVLARRNGELAPSIVRTQRTFHPTHILTIPPPQSWESALRDALFCESDPGSKVSIPRNALRSPDCCLPAT